MTSGIWTVSRVDRLDILEVNEAIEKARRVVRCGVPPQVLEVVHDVTRGEGLPIVPRDAVTQLQGPHVGCGCSASADSAKPGTNG